MDVSLLHTGQKVRFPETMDREAADRSTFPVSPFELSLRADATRKQETRTRS